MPKVSVIIPSFNRSNFLRSAIESVLKQTFQDFEIIVVDDASTEDVLGIVQGFCDKRIKYIRHETNKGEAGARNTGLTHSRGEFIAFLDDDDEWFPEKLGLQVAKLEDSLPGTGLIYTGILAIDPINNRRWQVIPSYRGNTYQELMKKNIIVTPSTVLLKKECTETVGLFDSNIAYGLDYDYWIRIAKNYVFEYIPEPLVKYRVHDNRLSTNFELLAQGARDLEKKYGKPMILNSTYWQSVVFKLGVSHCNKGEMTKGIRALLWCIIHNPSNRRPYFYVGMALLGPRYFRKSIIMKDKLRTYLRDRKSAVK
jgi:glycosyltransferase involved in cell wall biosynthesis